jgi:hypothetical protein
VRLLALALAALLFGCAAAAETETGGSSGPPPGCDGSGEDAQSACVAVVADMETYGCMFSSACDAACPGVERVCLVDVATCRDAAASALAGVAPEDLAAACQSVSTYCSSILVCKPFD